MIKAKHSAFLFLILFSVCLFSAPPPGSMGRGYRFNFGPSIGFYSVNTNHARNPSARMSALIGFKKEISTDNQYRTFFLFGVDYFFHGVSFKSYYFKPDSIHLYNKNFSYDYSLFIQEINVPLQFKYSFTKENNSLYSPYVMIGYHLRYLFPARVKVDQDGMLQSNKSENLKFRNPLIAPAMNSFLSLSFGWQKNTVNHSRTGFFIEANFRYGFSQYYFQSDYAASSLYMNGSHLSLLLGIKF